MKVRFYKNINEQETLLGEGNLAIEEIIHCKPIIQAQLINDLKLNITNKEEVLFEKNEIVIKVSFINFEVPKK